MWPIGNRLKKVIRTIVWSVALYGSETWTLIKYERDRSDAIEMWTLAQYGEYQLERSQDQRICVREMKAFKHCIGKDLDNGLDTS